MEIKKIRCKICNSIKNGITLPNYNLKVCLECFPAFFKKRVKDTVEKFKMFDSEAALLVALSGGKDSMSLTKALNDLGYKVRALHINMQINGISGKTEEIVKKFCDSENISLKILKLKDFLDFPLDKISKISKKPACAVCGTIRRYILNTEAKEYETVVTGHTLNDEVSFILKNLIFWDEQLLSRINPVLIEKQSLRRKAKPLCLTTEQETEIFCILSGIEYIDESCPYKSEIYNVFKDITGILNKKFPGALIGFYKGYIRKIKKFAEDNHRSISTNRCKICGYTTTAEICSICRLKEKLLEYKDG